MVIAPEAQSAPDHAPPEYKRAFSQTVPSLVRSAPNASLTPPAPAAAADDFNPYAPKKGKGKVIGAVAGAALLLVASVVIVQTLGPGNREASPAASPAAASDVVRATTVGASAPTPEPAQTAPIPSPARTTADEPTSAPVAVRSASERLPAKAKAKTKAKADSGALAARPVTRAPAPEPSPAPTRPASKGVIVRDAPF